MTLTEGITHCRNHVLTISTSLQKKVNVIRTKEEKNANGSHLRSQLRRVSHHPMAERRMQEVAEERIKGLARFVGSTKRRSRGGRLESSSLALSPFLLALSPFLLASHHRWLIKGKERALLNPSRGKIRGEV
ncbi:hypothetical protein BHM03_00036451 [Ensete ventricosum]|nr:hypothetical protein BHM03_00036451 [Ensete ventricosum]